MIESESDLPYRFMSFAKLQKLFRFFRCNKMDTASFLVASSGVCQLNGSIIRLVTSNRFEQLHFLTVNPGTITPSVTIIPCKNFLSYAKTPQAGSKGARVFIANAHAENGVGDGVLSILFCKDLSMDLKVNKHRVHLHQFSNIVLGTSILALLLSMNSPFASGFTILQQAVVFVFAFFAIFHTWWRNAELYTSSKVRSGWVYLLGLGRLVLQLLAILWLRALTAPINTNTELSVFFALIALASWMGWMQQIHLIRPLYGRSRVMQKREFLADLFYAVSVTLFTAGLVFAPDLVFGYIGFAVLAFFILIGRPIAKAATQWEELEPPHRGGRTRRSDSRRQQDRARAPRGSGQRRHSGQSASPRHRSADGTPRRAATDQRRSRPQERERQRSQRGDDSSSATKRPHERRQRTNRPKPQHSDSREDTNHSTKVSDRKQQPTPETSKNSDSPAKKSYGRGRRGKKPAVGQVETGSKPETAAKNQQTEKTTHSETTSSKPRYGRKRVKSGSAPKSGNNASPADAEQKQAKLQAAEENQSS